MSSSRLLFWRPMIRATLIQHYVIAAASPTSANSLSVKFPCSPSCLTQTVKLRRSLHACCACRTCPCCYSRSWKSYRCSCWRITLPFCAAATLIVPAIFPNQWLWNSRSHEASWNHLRDVEKVSGKMELLIGETSGGEGGI